jgi:hypothetical protein
MCQYFIPFSFSGRDYADNDQGPNASAQHDIPREIRKAPRKRSGQVHRGKPPFFSLGGPISKLNNFL